MSKSDLSSISRFGVGFASTIGGFGGSSFFCVTGGAFTSGFAFGDASQSSSSSLSNASASSGQSIILRIAFTNYYNHRPHRPDPRPPS